MSQFCFKIIFILEFRKVWNEIVQLDFSSIFSLRWEENNKKKEIERCVRILEIQGNSWNEANENKRKIGVYSRHARVYTLKAFCKPIPNRKLQVKRDAKGWGGGRFSTWWPTWCKNLWLHVSDNRESGRGNARIIGSPDNRCSNSRCLDNWRFTLTK